MEVGLVKTEKELHNEYHDAIERSRKLAQEAQEASEIAAQAEFDAKSRRRDAREAHRKHKQSVIDKRIARRAWQARSDQD